jgi:quinol monooxygenase YgiN
MGQMVLMTEYRTRPGKRDELFQVFERFLAHQKTSGRDFVVWSKSTTERDASFLFEYWNDAESFGDLMAESCYADFVLAVDQLVKTAPTTTVSVPLLVA